MQALVLDVSVTVAWFIPDERNVSTQALLARVVEEGAVVPRLWPIEVANALTMAVRRGRLTTAQRRDALYQLANLQLSSDDQTIDRAWGSTLELADRFRLTLYDACYLELAQRRKLQLATFNRDLRAAAKALEIDLVSG